MATNTLLGSDSSINRNTKDYGSTDQKPPSTPGKTSALDGSDLKGRTVQPTVPPESMHLVDKSADVVNAALDNGRNATIQKPREDTEITQHVPFVPFSETDTGLKLSSFPGKKSGEILINNISWVKNDNSELAWKGLKFLFLLITSPIWIPGVAIYRIGKLFKDVFCGEKVLSPVVYVPTDISQKWHREISPGAGFTTMQNIPVPQPGDEEEDPYANEVKNK